MTKLEGDETNANSWMQDLQTLQDAARRRRGQNATLWFQVFFVLVCIHLGPTPRVPPRVLASGPKLCGTKNFPVTQCMSINSFFFTQCMSINFFGKSITNNHYNNNNQSCHSVSVENITRRCKTFKRCYRCC